MPEWVVVVVTVVAIVARDWIKTGRRVKQELEREERLRDMGARWTDQDSEMAYHEYLRTAPWPTDEG